MHPNKNKTCFLSIPCLNQTTPYSFKLYKLLSSMEGQTRNLDFKILKHLEGWKYILAKSGSLKRLVRKHTNNGGHFLFHWNISWSTSHLGYNHWIKYFDIFFYKIVTMGWMRLAKRLDAVLLSKCVWIQNFSLMEKPT